MGKASATTRRTPRLGIEPLTPDRFPDLEALFGSKGACGGCWCMTPRLTRAEYERNKGSKNKAALKRIVARRVPGVLAYHGTRPVGWCSIEPREAFPVLANSRILKPVDDRPVWSITCLFVDKDYRGRGVSVKLLQGAVKWARSQGARIVEGYPVEPKKKPMPPVFAWTGIASAYLRAGFREVARRSPTRPIMRFS